MAIAAAILFFFMIGEASSVTYTYSGTSTACSVITIATSGAISCTPATGTPVFTIPSPLTPNPCYGLTITSAGAVSCATNLPQCALTATPDLNASGYTITLTASNCTQNPTLYTWTGKGLSNITTSSPSNTALLSNTDILPYKAKAGSYPYSVTASNATGAGAIVEATVNAAIAGYRGPYAYIAHTKAGATNGTLSVVDTTAELAFSIIAQISLQAGPVGVALNPAGSKVYVTNSGSNSVSVIETGKHGIVPIADPTNVGNTRSYIDLGTGKVPWGIAVSTSGSKVYVANSGENSVSVIDAESNTVNKNIASVGRPYGIAVNPIKPKLYVTNYNDNTVAVIDTDKELFLNTVNPGTYSFNKPIGVAVAPAGAYVYVANQGNGTTAGTVSVIDTATDTIIHSVNVGKGPTGVAVNPTGDKVYVVNSTDNTVSVINAATYVVTTAINSGGAMPEYIAFNQAGVMAYATHYNSGDVSKIDIASGNVIDVAPADSTVSAIPVRNHPSALGDFVGPAISSVQSEIVTAYEYYHSGLNHYFMTASFDEAKAKDVVTTTPRWERTGKTWLVWKSAASSLSPVCRFFGTDKYDVNRKRIGANSHFYTADSAECDFIKTAYQTSANDGSLPFNGQLWPAWTWEENSFYAVSTAGACPSGTTPIYRLYNNGQGGEPNHRYYIDTAVKTEMLAKGWVAEPANGNPVMCGPPQ